MYIYNNSSYLPTTFHFTLQPQMKTLTRRWGLKKKIKLKLPYTATGVASSRARTPGSCLPSNSSKLAPPPVEMWLITEATPTFSTAATESPPPMIVVTPFPLSSASFFATACKQWYNFNSLSSHSRTKRWQLHKMVGYFTSNLGMASHKLVHHFRQHALVVFLSTRTC